MEALAVPVARLMLGLQRRIFVFNELDAS